MTIKQTFILFLTTIAFAQVNAMDRNYPAKNIFQNPGTINIKSSVVVVNQGNGSVFVHPAPYYNPYVPHAPHVPYQPYYPQYPQPQYYPQTPHPHFQQQQTQQAQARAAEQAKKEREKAESEEKFYTRLKNYHAVHDYLAEKDSKQVVGIMKKCPETEAKSLAELVVNRIDETPEGKKIKPFIEILREDAQPKITQKPLEKSSEVKTLYFQAPKTFLEQKVEISLWQTQEENNTQRVLSSNPFEAKNTTSENICSQLQLLENNKSQWQQIAFGEM